MYSIKKKTQKLDPVVVSTISSSPKAQTGYQRLMIDMMSKLVVQTRRNNDIISEKFSKPMCSTIDQKTHLRNVTNQSPDKNASSFIYDNGSLSTARNKENSSILQVDQTNQKHNLFAKNYKLSSSHQQFPKVKMSSSPDDRASQKDSKIQKALVNLQKRLKNSQQINKKLLQKIQTIQVGNLNTQQKSRKNIRRASQVTNLQSIDLINQLIRNPHNDQDKNSYAILQQILPHSDRRQIKIKFKLNDIINKNNSKGSTNLGPQVSEWLGMVYRATASICWNMLLNNYLNFQEVKVLFTENIVFNFITLMNQLKDLGYQSQRQQLTNLINAKSVDILDFLCRQYPQTKIQAPNMALKNILKPIQNSGKIKYDIVSRSGVRLTYDKDRDYTPQIMKIINTMIIQSNEQYGQFYDYMKNIFEQVFFPSNKRRKTKTNEEKQKAQTSEDNKDRQQTHQDLVYRQKVKSYTKYLIGRKISKNTAIYTDQEMQDGVFFVKSSGVLRIITKWVEQLMEIIQQPQAKIKNSSNQNKDHFGNSMYISSQIKNMLYKQCMKKKKDLQSKIQVIKKQCYKMELLLTMQNFTTDDTQMHLSHQQINVGMFCSNLKSAISSYICAQLNEIIHELLSLPIQLKIEQYIPEQQITLTSQVKKDLQSVNLVTFKIFDLLRCKIHSNEEQIIWIVEQLLRQNQFNKDKFNIVRIKDRLHLGTRDIMINAQINKGLACEIQLAVTSQSDKKQQLLDSYNHFLYELKRSKLGPLTENVSIWSTLEQRYSYFEQLRKKKMKMQVKSQIKPLKYDLDSYKPFKRPIICICCNNFFAIPKTCLLNVSCSQNKETICGQCFYYKYLNYNQRKSYIFEGNRLLKPEVMNQLKQYTNFQDPLPTTGFFVKKNFLKKQLSFYMAVQKNKVKDVHTSDNIEILVVQTVVRNQQIINRQLNKKDIEARLDKKQFYVKDYTKSQLNNYIIFYFDIPKDKMKKVKAMMKLQDIEQQLKAKKQKIKVLNILKEPCYINNLKLLKKETQQVKEFNYLKNKIKDKEIVVYKFQKQKLYILAQVVVPGGDLRNEITKKNNLGTLKMLVQNQSDTISMENKKLTNQFQELPEKIKDKFPTFAINLKKLFLAKGQISSIKAFKQFSNVEFIVISDNQLKSLQGVQNLQKLAYFRFDGNQIESLKPLTNISSLKTLYANKNKINSLKGIQNKKELRILSLYNNNISEISQLQQLPQLLQLYLKSNPITDLSSIKCLINLNKLFLGDNKTSVLPNISSMEGLKCLSLEKMDLEQIPQITVAKLHQLHLGQNKIKSINNNLKNLTELYHLNLSDNQIEKIENLCCLSNLEILNLADNKITKVTGLRNIDDSLKKLDLRNNQIQDFGDMTSYEISFKFQVTPEKLSSLAQKQKHDIQNYGSNTSQSDE